MSRIYHAKIVAILITIFCLKLPPVENTIECVLYFVQVFCTSLDSNTYGTKYRPSRDKFSRLELA